MRTAEPPILLIHGLGVDHRMWALQERALEPLGAVYAPDLPGFGDEPPLEPDRRSPEAYADWLAAAVERQGYGSVRVAGYSMGGTLGLLLALRHPHRVVSLAACCTSPCWGRGARKWLARIFAGAGGLASMELFQKSVLWAFSRHSYSAEQRSAVEDMVARAHRPTMLALYRALAGLDLRPRLGAVRAPVAAVAGGRDWLAPPAHARILSRGLGGAEVQVLEGADHILCFGRAPELSSFLAGFFGRQSDPAVRPGATAEGLEP